MKRLVILALAILSFGALCETGRVGRTAQALSLDGTCTLEDFGAVGDGVTSDQAAYDSARVACGAGTCKTLLLGARTYLVAPVNTAPWPMGCSIMGQGPSSILRTTSNTSVVLLADPLLANRQKSTQLSSFAIEGNSTGAFQNGIKVGYFGADGASKVRISNITARHLGGFGIGVCYGDDIAHGPQIETSHVHNSGTGYSLCQSTMNNSSAVACTLGIAAGGNVTVTGGIVRGCVTGTRITSGGNDSHGAFTGVQFLHNTIAVRADAIRNGHLFSGCLFYEGAMQLDPAATSPIVFEGGLMDLTTYTLAGPSRFVGVTMNTAYYQGHTATARTDFVNVRKLDGTVPAWVGSIPE